MTTIRTTEGIYLLREREFINNKRSLYKIGRSHSLDTRLKHYPKGSEIIILMACTNSITIETKLINDFRKRFTQCLEIGREYFEGNKDEMVQLIYTTIMIEVAIPKNNELVIYESLSSQNTSSWLYSQSIYMFNALRDKLSWSKQPIPPSTRDIWIARTPTVDSMTSQTMSQKIVIDISKDTSDDDVVIVRAVSCLHLRMTPKKIIIYRNITFNGIETSEVLYKTNKQDNPMLLDLIKSSIITEASISTLRTNKVLLSTILANKTNIRLQYLKETLPDNYLVHWKDIYDYLENDINLNTKLKSSRSMQDFLTRMFDRTIILNGCLLVYAPECPTYPHRIGLTIEDVNINNMFYEKLCDLSIITIDDETYATNFLRRHVPACIVYSDRGDYYFLDDDNNLVGMTTTESTNFLANCISPQLLRTDRQILYEYPPVTLKDYKEYSMKVRKLLRERILIKRLDSGIALYDF